MRVAWIVPGVLALIFGLTGGRLWFGVASAIFKGWAQEREYVMLWAGVLISLASLAFTLIAAVGAVLIAISLGLCCA